MQQIINQMLNRYKAITLEEEKNAIKEIVQECVLCGLARAGFFSEAAFYGGTALRIFYGLDRFSEDLDFSLVVPNEDFNLSKYIPILENEIKSYGLEFSIEEKIKTPQSNIKSAFLKGNIKEHILTFYQDSENAKFINKEEKINIKFEIDVMPPCGATFENKIGLLPSPHQVRVYDLPSLFAGKIHACICRNWKTRVKGRDFYDYVYLLSFGTKVNLELLKAKLVQSKFVDEDFNLTIETLKDILNKRFMQVNFEQAKEDVLPFIKDKSKLDIWSSEFFIEITKQLTAM